ncbi:MAG: phenylalanine--tRNA ligase subunit alpha [Patescibacteria group bacterium]|nr:phenylalanine--tRNA ligase subunit alpha [Patescibacteria group bacterium]
MRLKLRYDRGMSEEETVKGHLHPISRAILDIRSIFAELGFEVGIGSEIESEWYNFDALNIAKDHPARDMQDTFWLKPLSERKLLRTHNTALTARAVEAYKDRFPVRKIFPGKVFRNEATDATHEAQFFQMDGMYVDKNVSLAHLKGVLTHFYKRFLGDDVVIRFRPSFFSFTEPSVEIDIQYKGRWLEILGGGMIHPNVFKTAGVDPKEWSGFAFGGSIDRPIMIKYGIDDIRYFYNGDLRIVNQF